jgi:hypothetical protein
MTEGMAGRNHGGPAPLPPGRPGPFRPGPPPAGSPGPLEPRQPLPGFPGPSGPSPGRRLNPLRSGPPPRRSRHSIGRVIQAISAFSAVIALSITVALSPCFATEIYQIVDSEAGRFLTVCGDPRGEAMGQACSALADGISAVPWNPAGLAFAEGVEVVDQGHMLRPTGWDADWSRDIDFKFVGASLGIGSMWGHIPLGTVSVWRKSADYASIIQHTDLGDRRLGHLDESALGITYAHLIRGVFAIGVTYKRVSADWGFQLDGFDPSAWATIDYSGTGWDVGMLYRSTFRLGARADLEVNAAFGERNLGRVTVEGSQPPVKYSLPERHFVGIAPSLRLRHGDVVLTLSAERTMRKEDRSWSAHFGAELLLKQGIAVRAGTYEADETSETVDTVGLGFRLRYGRLIGIAYDWAHSQVPFDSANVHRHMLSVSLLRASGGIDLQPLLRYE